LLRSALGSAAIHAVVLGCVVALEAWLAPAIDPAKFGGRQRVVHVEFSASAESHAAPPSEFELPPLPPATESVVPPDVSPAPLPATEVEPGPAIVLAKRVVANMTTDLPLRENIEPTPPQPRSISIARPREREQSQPEVATAPPQKMSKQAAVQSPSSLAARVPPLAGTDAETPPEFAGNRRPNYPADAYRRGIQGEVTLRIHVAASGQVERVEIARSSGYGILDRAAADAVRTWRGSPARRQGVAVASVHLLPVHFRLRR
jgi:protein TonB